MSSASPKTDWYLARDGRQHGPISDVEMRKLVELGHLKPTDLVWRAGLTEWVPAPTMFPREAAAPPATAPRQPQTAPMAARPAAAAPARAEPQPRSPEAAAMAAAAQYTHVVAQPETPTRPTGPGRAPAPAWPMDLSTARPERPTTGPGRPAAAPAPAQVPKPGQPGGVPSPMRQAPLAAPTFRDNVAPDPPASRGRWGRRVALAAMLVMLATGVSLAWQYRDRLLTMMPGRSVTVADFPPEALRAPPFRIGGTTSDAVDSGFQRAAIWQVIKREYPDWYADRVKETTALKAENREDTAIAKRLVEAIVDLRRKHADQALAASQERLKFLATAFLDNLRQLSKHSTEACYSFISQGETSGMLLPLLQNSDFAATFQRQFAAVVEAAAEGRKSPRTNETPIRSDYDALATELTRIGWTESDLQLFSDPRALSKATPQQVCKMVQDWFAAQIAIKDRSTQIRLLVESLRPVVAG